MSIGLDHTDVELFIRLDRLGAALGASFVVVMNGLYFRSGGAWLIVPVLLGLVAGLSLASRELRAGKLLTALVLVAATNWAAALVIPVLLPFLWPVMALTVLMPLVLASPHLSRTQIVPAIVAAAVIAAIVATIGLLNDDGGVIDDVDDAVELVVVIGSLAAQIIPIGLVVWMHNQMQRTNVGSLETLNAELVASQAEVAASRDRVVQAADTERRRIERDLHDGAQQRLVALGVRLRLLESQGHEDPVVRDGISTLIEELDGAIDEVRELAHGIYPPLLQTRGLPDALAAVVRRSPLEISTDIGEIERLDEPLETALYFTALEALTNAAKHAGTAQVTLDLHAHHGEVVLKVSDNGPGFDVETVARSHGFNNLQDRLAAVGGALDIRSRPGSGTTVTAVVGSASPSENL